MRFECVADLLLHDRNISLNIFFPPCQLSIYRIHMGIESQGKARQLKIFATVHRIKGRIIVLIPPRIITPLWIRLTRLFPFNDYFSAPIFVTDEIGCEATSSCLRRTATWMNVWRRWGWELVTIEPIAKERAIRVIIPLQIAFPSRCIFEFSEAIVISVALADAPAFRVK